MVVDVRAWLWCQGVELYQGAATNMLEGAMQISRRSC